MWDLEIQPYSLCDAVCVWYSRYTIVDIDTPNESSNSRRVLLVS